MLPPPHADVKEAQAHVGHLLHGLLSDFRPTDRIVIIDGTGSIESVQAACREAVLALIADVAGAGGGE